MAKNILLKYVGEMILFLIIIGLTLLISLDFSILHVFLSVFMWLCFWFTLNFFYKSRYEDG